MPLSEIVAGAGGEAVIAHDPVGTPSTSTVAEAATPLRAEIDQDHAISQLLSENTAPRDAGSAPHSDTTWTSRVVKPVMTG